MDNMLSMSTSTEVTSHKTKRILQTCSALKLWPESWVANINGTSELHCQLRNRLHDRRMKEEKKTMMEDIRAMVWHWDIGGCEENDKLHIMNCHIETGWLCRFHGILDFGNFHSLRCDFNRILFLSLKSQFFKPHNVINFSVMLGYDSMPMLFNVHTSYAFAHELRTQILEQIVLFTLATESTP